MGSAPMQVTDTQVQRSLEALISEHSPPGPPDELVGAIPRSGGAADGALSSVPEGLVEQLTESSPVRDDRLQDARRRLASGETPSDQALADRMVGRLVCDRLR
jgi:hypothetical protein